MDQAGLEAFLDDVRGALGGMQDLATSAGDPSRPLVVLVHGIGGSAQHWSDPVGIDVNTTWLFDTSATAQPQPCPDVAGLLMSPPYGASAMQSWTQALQANGISWLNFTQSQPQGALAVAVDELKRILMAIEPQAASANAPPPLALLCHSRGGLVARQALKDLGGAALPHLNHVVTLCTPHAGSWMPRLSRDYDRTLQEQVDVGQLDLVPGLRGVLAGLLTPLANYVRLSLLHAFGAMPEGPAFDELLPGSELLQQLAAGEEPLPNVTYTGFGGSAPGVVSLYAKPLGHALKLLTLASAPLTELFDRTIPLARSQYGGLAELDQGDSAVSLASSHWPDSFAASWQQLPLNHMQALVDPSLQRAVVSVLGG